MPPPVLGFNNNVRHRGRIFHIQTEDSGVRFSRIVTHLFADGGRIIKTAKTDYAEHVEKGDVSRIVRALMKEQHRAMFTSLRAGELDPLLERAIGPLSEVPPRAARRAESARPTRTDSVRPGRGGRESERPRRQETPAAPASARAPRKSSPPSKRSRPPASVNRPGPVSLPQRPAAQFAGAPEATARSIFGNEAISEQTLDEVILSYLAEDLDGSQD